MSDAIAASTTRGWVQNKPEQLLSIATYRFLNRALLPPFYVTMIHDSDEGARSDLQRIRDANRGITTGQLDGDIVQGNPSIARKLELKRGKNTLSPKQKVTVATLIQCGFPPIVAWSLREVYDGCCEAGFRFAGNVAVILTHLEMELEAWDREAEIVKTTGASRKAAARIVRPRKKSGATWKL